MNSPTLLLRAALASSMSLLVSSTFATAAEEPGSLVAYIANAGNNNVQVVDVGSGATLNKLYTGTGPWRLTLTPDKKRLLVQNWYAETTAVVDLATHKIETVLPVRGPLIFDPAGKEMLAYSWPAAQFQSYDGKTFKPLTNKGTEDKSVYDMVLWKGQMAKGQYDPITKVGRKVFEHVLIADVDSKALSRAIRSGISPAKLVVDPSGDFLLTANFDDRMISVLNEYGDGRSITLAPGPRDIVFNKGGKQMIVIAWERHSAESDIFTLDTDFKERPWPKFTAHNAKHMRGGFVDAEMGADGLLYILDRPGNRLLAINPDTLAEVKSIPTGNEPVSFVLRQVSGSQYQKLTRKTADRKLVEDIFAKLKAKSKPFKDAAFTEAMTHAVIDEAAEKPKQDKNDKAKKDDKAAAKDKNPPKAKVINSVVKTQLMIPDAIRQETESGLIRIAEGGRSMAVTKEGRFADAPRQELLHVLYAAPGLSVDEIIRQLAGDVPGSPFLRNGIAVDVVNTVQEDGHKFYVIGTGKRGDPVSQLWIDAESGLPLSLVEQYPIIRSKNPHGDDDDKGFQGITETKLRYREISGRTFPVQLDRFIDGERIGLVSISNIVFDQNPNPAIFNLAALGNMAKPAQQPLASDKAAATGPGLGVAGQGNAHIDAPLADHVAYNTSPPTSGPHTAYLADWGVHKIPVPQEVQVHNLEDGGVMLQYACATPCDELVQQLEALTAKYDRLIVAPYPLMATKIALTAWQRIETLDDFDEKRITAFIEAYIGKDHHLPGGEPSSGDSDPYALPPMHPRIEK